MQGTSKFLFEGVRGGAAGGVRSFSGQTAEKITFFAAFLEPYVDILHVSWVGDDEGQVGGRVDQRGKLGSDQGREVGQVVRVHLGH